MKKFIVSAMALLLVGTTAVSAKSAEKVDARTERAFKKDFVATSGAEWSSDESYYYVSFVMNGEKLNAVYSKDDAEFAGYIARIEADHLPVTVLEQLKKQFSGYRAAGKAIEVGHTNSTSYILTIENEKQILKVKFDSDGSTVLSKLKKA